MYVFIILILILRFQKFRSRVQLSFEISLEQVHLTRLTPTSLCLFEHELFDYSRVVTITTNACVGDY